MIIHKPVLLKETVELLNLEPGMIVVDATLGGGGHSREIIKKIGPQGILIAIDQDKQAIDKFKSSSNLEKENAHLVNDNFARLKKILAALKIKKINAIVADLGISSDQLDTAERGFSFQKEGLLDMRMNQQCHLTAAYVVNNYSKEKLIEILKKLGEERHAARIAETIIENRKNKKIETTKDLTAIVASAIPPGYKHKKINFATKTFQAFRMEVNKELENLDRFLPQAVEALKSGGRIAVISFHSGEDRIVKNYFRENARGRVLSDTQGTIYGRQAKPILKLITKKPVIPSSWEIKINPRSRSAKLRVAEKL